VLDAPLATRELRFALGPRPMLAFALAAWAFDDDPAEPTLWEGRAIVIAPEPDVTIAAPPELAPGVSAPLTLRAPWAGPRAAAWIVVRDVRVTPGGDLSDREATLLHDHVRRWPQWPESALRGATSGVRRRHHIGDDLPRVRPDPASDDHEPEAPPARRRSLADATPQLDQTSTPAPGPAPEIATRAHDLIDPVGRAGPALLFADIVPLVDGEATVEVRSESPDGDYAVEVFVVDGDQSARAAHRLRVTSDTGAAFELPPAITLGRA